MLEPRALAPVPQDDLEALVVLDGEPDRVAGVDQAMLVIAGTARSMGVEVDG